MKIGVMGGATNHFEQAHLDKAFQLGEAIAKRGAIMVTGGCPGLPLAAAHGAWTHNGYVIGISPGLSLEEHVNKYESPTQFHNVLIYTGSGLMGREVVNIRSSDIVVIIGGRSGTLGELAIAYDEGKLIGVLKGTGGISDMVKDILKACEKDTGARVVYSENPEQLIEEVLRAYKETHYHRPSYFSEKGSAWGVPHSPKPGMERDLVCGMWIEPATAVDERKLEGVRYIFCSTACARTFDADPKKYIARNQANG